MYILLFFFNSYFDLYLNHFTILLKLINNNNNQLTCFNHFEHQKLIINFQVARKKVKTQAMSFSYVSELYPSCRVNETIQGHVEAVSPLIILNIVEPQEKTKFKIRIGYHDDYVTSTDHKITSFLGILKFRNKKNQIKKCRFLAELNENEDIKLFNKISEQNLAFSQQIRNSPKCRTSMINPSPGFKILNTEEEM
ncbi:hypothetical protein BpHYR1_050940 [Brachionus plicatilis]|uniref:Uncharacterized protein n=1 Tax=Brachionus plicatilis TaxID=10195 RepID=A0A3M7QSS0_BRAPC|nr:hypothetical protein BpHYR1_050940 [Brachionus plicatilis]